MNEAVTKLEVDLFTREEIDQYLSHFCMAKKLSKEETSLIGSLKEREYEILARPVQINMFTKIISSLSKSKNIELTRYRLYQEFVKRFVRREQGKRAREINSNNEEVNIGYNDPRSKFMQNIAWWMLTDRRENRFLPIDLPFDLLPSELKSKGNTTTSIREALIGSIVEHSDKEGANAGLIGKKGANYFYFPHKSYMEFLVSQYFCREQFSKEMYREFFSYANPEMISFVQEGPNIGAQNIAQGLEHVLGNVPRGILKIATSSSDFIKKMQEGRISTLSTPQKYLAYEYFINEKKWKDLERFLLLIVGSAKTNKTISPAFVLMSDHILLNPSKDIIPLLVKQSLEALPNVVFDELLTGSRTENYTDANFVNAFILCRCLQAHSDGVWHFKPLPLLSNGIKLAGSSMHCDGYGKADGKKLNSSIPINKDKIIDLISTQGGIRKKQVKQYFKLRSTPTLDIGGRAAELLS